MLAKAAQTAGLIFFRKPMGARGVFFVSKINFFQKSNLFFYVADTKILLPIISSQSPISCTQIS